jgi:hypothetical protein
MASYSISVPLAPIVPSGFRLDGGSLQTLSYAVERVAQATHARWVSFAQGTPLPDGQTIRTRNSDYAHSISLRQTGEFSAQVYSELPEAEGHETGFPARDLKKMLDTSAKTRVFAKSGKRYLIIPFAHGTPGSQVVGNPMPQAVHGWWKGKTASSITSVGRRPSQTIPGVFVPKRDYSWGDRLKKGDLTALGITGVTAKRTAGMVNFKRPGGKGGGSHSTFITFRTMVEGSSGWIVPAKPGRYPAKTAADEMRPVAEKAFKQALEDDLARIFNGGS